MKSKFIKSLICTLLLLTVGLGNAWGEAYTGALYIIGENLGCGWTPANAFDCINYGDGHYVWEGKLMGKTGDGFKFLTKKDWGDEYRAANGMDVTPGATLYSLKPQSAVGDNKFYYKGADGYFRIDIDLTDKNNGTIKLTALPTHKSGCYFIAGDKWNNWNSADAPHMLNGETTAYWREATPFESGSNTRFKVLSRGEDYSRSSGSFWGDQKHWSNFNQSKCTGSGATYDTDGDDRIRVTFTKKAYLTVYYDGTDVYCHVEPVPANIYVQGRFGISDGAGNMTYTGDNAGDWKDSSTEIKFAYDNATGFYKLETHRTVSELAANAGGNKQFFHFKEGATHYGAESINVAPGLESDKKTVISSSNNFVFSDGAGDDVVLWLDWDNKKFWYSATSSVTYTVTIYNGDHGTVSPTGVQTVGGAGLDLTPTPADGYALARWNVTGGASMSGNHLTATADGTVTAQWAQVHTITFNSNYGSAVTALKVADGQTAAQPADPTKAHCTFRGWFTDAALTSAYNWSSSVTADQTLYAKWEYTGATKYYLVGTFMGCDNWGNCLSNAIEMTKNGDHLEATLPLTYNSTGDLRFKVNPSTSNNWTNSLSWTDFSSARSTQENVTYNSEGSDSKKNIQIKLKGDEMRHITMCWDGVNVYAIITPEATYAVNFGTMTSCAGMGAVTATTSSNTLTTGDEVVAGTHVTFTATPASGYQFVEWHAGVDGSGDAAFVGESEVAFDVTAPANMYAKFEAVACTPTSYVLKHTTLGWIADFVATRSADEYELTFELKNDIINNLYVEDNCGNRYGCATAIEPGKNIPLTTAQSTFNFQRASQDKHWHYIFNSSTLVLSCDAQSEEEKALYTVTISSEDDNKGTVSPASVTANTITASGTITATPKSGYKFNHWVLSSGVTIAEGSTTAATIKVKASEAGTATAYFVERTLENIWLRSNYTGSWTSANTAVTKIEPNSYTITLNDITISSSTEFVFVDAANGEGHYVYKKDNCNVGTNVVKNSNSNFKFADSFYGNYESVTITIADALSATPTVSATGVKAFSSGWYMNGDGFGGWSNKTQYPINNIYRGIEGLYTRELNLTSSNSYFDFYCATNNKRYHLSTSNAAYSDAIGYANVKTLAIYSNGYGNEFTCNTTATVYVVIDDRETTKKVWFETSNTYYDVTVTGADAHGSYTLKDQVLDVECSQYSSNDTYVLTVTAADGYIPTLRVNEENVVWSSVEGNVYTYSAKPTEATTLSVSYEDAFPVTFSQGTIPGAATAVTATTGAGAIASGDLVVSGTEVTFTRPVAQEGYSFRGWYGDAAGTGAQLGTAETYVVTITAATEVYAVYEYVTYTISYVLNGSTNNPANPTEFTINSEDLTISAPTYTTDYAFHGWHDNADFTGDAITSIAHGSTGDKTLYAHWVPRYALEGSLGDDSDNGGMPGWGVFTNYFINPAAGKATYTATLTQANTDYKFAIWDEETQCRRGQTGTATMDKDNCTNWTMDSYSSGSGSQNDVYLKTTIAGNYTFTIDYSESFTAPKISVTYPTLGDVTIKVGCGSFWNGVKTYYGGGSHVMTDLGSDRNSVHWYSITIPAAQVGQKMVFFNAVDNEPQTAGARTHDITIPYESTCYMLKTTYTDDSYGNREYEVTTCPEGPEVVITSGANVVQGGTYTIEATHYMIPGAVTYAYEVTGPAGAVVVTNAKFTATTAGDYTVIVKAMVSGIEQARTEKTVTCSTISATATATPAAVNLNDKVTLSVETTGFTNPTYQWYVMLPATTSWITLANYNGQTAQYQVTQAGTYKFRVVVTEDGASVTSNEPEVEVTIPRYFVKYEHRGNCENDNKWCFEEMIYNVYDGCYWLFGYYANSESGVNFTNKEDYSKSEWKTYGSEFFKSKEVSPKNDCYFVYDPTDGKMSILPAGDYYRVKSATSYGTFYSNTVTLSGSENKEVSFFATTDGELKLEKLVGSSWSEQSTLSASISENNVYTASLSTSALSNVAVYTGNFTVYSEVFGAGKKTMQKFNNVDPSEFYNHYACEWIDIAGGKNAAATVGNEINHNLSIVLPKDVKNTISVRYAFHPETNHFSRAYLYGAINSGHENDFLVVYGTNVTKEDGTAITAAAHNQSTCQAFSDNSDWVYSTYIKATCPATIKLAATVDGNWQYLLDAGGSEATSRDVYGLVANQDPIELRFLISYDFKTNRVIAGWAPDGTEEISTAVTMDADLVVIRKAHNDQKPVLFSLLGEGQVKLIRRIITMIEVDRDSIFANSSGELKHAGTLKDRLFQISLPYDVQIAQTTGLDNYGTKLVLQSYLGELRAAMGWQSYISTFWANIPFTATGKLMANSGYVISNQWNYTDFTQVKIDDKTDKYLAIKRLYFPSEVKDEGYVIGPITRYGSTTWDALTCHISGRENIDSNWRMIGLPGFFAASVDSADPEGTDTGHMPYDPEDINYVEPRYTLHWIYDWNGTYGSYTAYKATDFRFEPTKAYMAQYAGTVTWAEPVANNQNPSLENFPVEDERPASVLARQTSMPAVEHAEYRLELYNADAQFEDQTFVVLDAEASEDYEPNLDLQKALTAAAPQIYSLSANQLLAANTLSAETDIIPLGVALPADGVYTLHLGKMSRGSLRPYLYDAMTNRYTCLTSANYTFSAEAGQTNDRFSLVLDYQAPAITTELNQLEAETLRVSVINGRIVITGATANSAMLYDAAGRLVSTTALDRGNALVAPGAQGVYLLRVGEQTVKVNL